MVSFAGVVQEMVPFFFFQGRQSNDLAFLFGHSKTFQVLIQSTTSNKNFILRCRDGKRTETRIGMEGICITHSCIPLYTVYMHATHNGSQWWNAGMGNTDTLHPNSCFCSFSIPTSEIHSTSQNCHTTFLLSATVQAIGKKDPSVYRADTKPCA